MVASPRCPTCDRPFDPTRTTAMPFCSERCRQIDLGRWLREKHSVPAPPRDDEELEERLPDESPE